jgi:hypothetical protein
MSKNFDICPICARGKIGRLVFAPCLTHAPTTSDKKLNLALQKTILRDLNYNDFKFGSGYRKIEEIQFSDEATTYFSPTSLQTIYS